MQLSSHLGIGLGWRHLRRQSAVGDLHRRNLPPLPYHDANSVHQESLPALVEFYSPRNARVRVTRCNQWIQVSGYASQVPRVVTALGCYNDSLAKGLVARRSMGRQLDDGYLRVPNLRMEAEVVKDEKHVAGRLRPQASHKHLEEPSFENMAVRPVRAL